MRQRQERLDCPDLRAPRCHRPWLFTLYPIPMAPREWQVITSCSHSGLIVILNFIFCNLIWIFVLCVQLNDILHGDKYCTNGLPPCSNNTRKKKKKYVLMFMSMTFLLTFLIDVTMFTSKYCRCRLRSINKLI